MDESNRFLTKNRFSKNMKGHTQGIEQANLESKDRAQKDVQVEKIQWASSGLLRRKRNRTDRKAVSSEQAIETKIANARSVEANRFDESRIETSNTMNEDRKTNNRESNRLSHSGADRRVRTNNPAELDSERYEIDAESVGNNINESDVSSFEDPRAGRERRQENLPYLMPEEGCRRRRNRRAWRSGISRRKWWMMRSYVRSD